MASLQDVITNMNEIEGRLAALEKANSEHLSKFGFYWINEHMKVFCIISRVIGSKADLIAFWAGWSGGISVITDAPLIDLDPLLPLDEQVKTGRWEPSQEIPQIIIQALANAKVPANDENRAKAATAS